MVNFSVTATDSYPKTLALQARNAQKVCGVLIDFQMDITLILDFTLIAQITVVVFDTLKEARTRGLVVPIVLMGYLNPILQYHEPIKDGEHSPKRRRPTASVDTYVKMAKENGADGFIVVDMPPDDVRVCFLCGANCSKPVAVCLTQWCWLTQIRVADPVSASGTASFCQDTCFDAIRSWRSCN